VEESRRERVDLVAKVVGLTRNGAAAPQPGGAAEAFQPTEQGLMYRGYGDGLSRALEFALTPAVCCGIGYAFDRWLGILPVLSIVFFLLAVVGMFAKTWYTYEARMREEDAASPWARIPGPE
jgi:hypothetical protein